MSGGCQGGIGLAHRAASRAAARKHDQARGGKSGMPGVADDPGALKASMAGFMPAIAPHPAGHDGETVKHPGRDHRRASTRGGAAVAPVSLAVPCDRPRLAAAVPSQRLADVVALLEAARCASPDIALVALSRLDQLSLRCHAPLLLARRPAIDAFAQSNGG